MRRSVALFALVAMIAIFAGQQGSTTSDMRRSLRDAKQLLDRTSQLIGLENGSDDEAVAPGTTKQVRRGISDQTGKIRPELWQRAVRQTQRMAISPFLHPSKKRAQTVSRAAQAPLTGSQWTQIGPGPLRTGSGGFPIRTSSTPARSSTSRSVPRGRPTRSSTSRRTTAGFGRRRTAARMGPPRRLHASLSIGAVAVDPTNPANVWAGTGDYFDGGGFYSGNGAFARRRSASTSPWTPGPRGRRSIPAGSSRAGIQKIVFRGR